eukprot:6186623-Pleurochrysis_carterae.AAC.2
MNALCNADAQEKCAFLPSDRGLQSRACLIGPTSRKIASRLIMTGSLIKRFHGTCREMRHAARRVSSDSTHYNKIAKEHAQFDELVPFGAVQKSDAPLAETQSSPGRERNVARGPDKTAGWQNLALTREMAEKPAFCSHAFVLGLWSKWRRALHTLRRSSPTSPHFT